MKLTLTLGILAIMMSTSAAFAKANSGAPSPDQPSLEDQYRQQQDADEAAKAAQILGVPASDIVDYKISGDYVGSPCRYEKHALVKLRSGRIENVLTSATPAPYHVCYGGPI